MSGPAVPIWVSACAHAVPLCTLPSGLWRTAMAIGIPVGFSPEVLRDLYDVPGRGTAAIIALSVVVEALALLTIGLIRPWGETFPTWLPVLGGRPASARGVTAIALSGAVIVTVLCWSQVPVWFAHGDADLHGIARTIMGLSYAPLLAWGPLLGVVTVAYRRRRRTAAGKTPDPRGGRRRYGASPSS